MFTLHSSTGKLYNVSFSTDEVNEIVSFVRVIPSIEFVLKERKVRERKRGRKEKRGKVCLFVRERERGEGREIGSETNIITCASYNVKLSL